MFFDKIWNTLKAENLYLNSRYSFKNPSSSLKTTVDSYNAFQKKVKEHPNELERYTVMCNAQIEHEDDIYHYN